MVNGLQKNIPSVGIYIWDGLPYDKETNLTQHTILYTGSMFEKMSDNKSIADWMTDAINGDIKTYGLELLDKQY